MNKQGITAMVAAAALTGLIHAHAAQENIDATPRNDNMSEQNSVEQKPLIETFVPVATTPVPVIVQPAEKFLSELKVYPTF